MGCMLAVPSAGMGTPAVQQWNGLVLTTVPTRPRARDALGICARKSGFPVAGSLFLIADR